MPATVDIDYKALARELVAESGGQRSTTKAVSGTPDASYGHGPGGLFSSPGLDPRIFSAMVLPQQGLASRLPVRPTIFENPLYGIMTGVTATTGNEPTTVCGDFPEAGMTKLCTHSFVFGRQGRSTPVIDITRVGRYTNSGETMMFQFLNNPFNQLNNANVPTGLGNDGPATFNNEISQKLFELATVWSRDFAREVYTGNPSNNQGSGRKYFYGLDTLINTGYRDAETAQACIAADSLIMNFANARVDQNGAALVRQITYMARNLRFLSRRAGLDPVKWVITMPFSMFYEITAIWPCSYLTANCPLPTGSTQFVTASDQIALRDRMRNENFLLIDGEEWEVITDDAITEVGPVAGVFTAPIYFVPLTVLGNVPVTFFEYFNYDSQNGPMAAANAFAGFGSQPYYKTSDGGRFLWHAKPPTNYCVQMQVVTEPRLLMLTPYIAAKLTGVGYAPLLHERSGFTDSTYFYNGGKTNRTGLGPSFYSPTA